MSDLSLLSRLHAVALFLFALLPSSAIAGIPADVHLTPFITSGLAEPLAIRSPHDGSGRVFVVERGGAIRVVAGGVLQAAPYYTRAVDTGDIERGLLGLAFDPDFASNGTLYVVYTASGASGEILRRLVAKNPAANVFSGTDTQVMRVPLFYNHNGGDIHFGPDGYLYWSTGSGTGSFDPEDLAQNLWKKTVGGQTYYLMGKMLRIDVRTPSASAAANMCGATAGEPAQYSIPAGNPYAGADESCAEIWLYGFRNPWRWSFDRLNGDMWIGDVGEGSWEEIDLRPAGGSDSRNYGYPLCEGNHHGRPAGSGSTCAAKTGTAAPAIEYSHANSRCSVTGGYRYRGPVAALQGYYVFGDACTGEVLLGSESGGAWSFAPLPPGVGAGYGTVAGFGEGEDGTLYLADLVKGGIWRFDGKASADLIFQNGFD
jgi:glucose/arabinose dehydrogenase